VAHSDIFTASITPNAAAIAAAVIGLIIPTGLIAEFGGAGVPNGWLACDGSAVSRTTYAVLFNVISTTWGVGDGSTTFNLPDLRSRSPVGAGAGTSLTNRVLGTTGGEENHAIQVSEMPPHNHPVNDPGHGHTYPNTGSAGGGPNLVEGAPNAGTGANINNAATGVTTTNTGGGSGHNTMHPWAAVTFIIKT
jgi:microcystin-dependent protein